MYPAFAEQIGINLYINSIIGLTQTHPELKDKYEFKIYDKGMLYSNQSEALEAVSDGALQMTYSGPHFLEELDSAWKLGEIPGVFENWDHYLRTMDTPAWRALHKKMAEKEGVTIIKWLFDTGTWYLFTKIGPVNSLADIKGQKIRFAGGEAFAKALKGLNTIPIALPSSEVVTALQTNMIEGLLTDFTGGVGYYELPRNTKYAILVPFGNQPICMVANTKWWNSLPEKVRGALNIPFDQIDVSGFYSKLEQTSIKKWDDNPNLTAVKFDDAEVAIWQKAMRSSFGDMFEKIDPTLIKAINSAR
ncbi:MAG: ABC transporter substrate-binding protein [Desulfobacteraceae bacterium]|nr:ABC transporter substrate-binding protein [Desulfobacteraceae bacterium]